MTPDNSTAMHDLAAAYALDALPADEAEAFEAHLSTCTACTDEVASLRDVAADLAGLASATPPADLRGSVLDAIADLPQVAAPSSDERTDGRPDAPVTDDVEGDDPGRIVTIRPDAVEPDVDDGGMAQVVSLAEHRRTRRAARVASGVAAALVLVVGGLGLWATNLNDQVGDLSGQVDDLDQQLVALDDQLQDREDVAAQVTAVLNAPDAQLINETGSSLILSPGQDQAVFAPGALAAPGEDEVLQLWVIDDRGATSAGLVEDPAAPTLLDIPVPDGSIVGVTVEPAGGSDQPTSDPVVVFDT